MWKILIAIAALIYAIFYALDVVLTNGRKLIAQHETVKNMTDDEIENYII